MSFFLVPALFSKFILNLNVLARLPITSACFCGLNGSDLFMNTSTENLVVNEDALDVDYSVAVVDMLCCNWSVNFFIKR